jgi:prephenate dehydratase
LANVLAIGSKIGQTNAFLVDISMTAMILAHLGPTGTYAETAALAYAKSLNASQQSTELVAYNTIAQAIEAVVSKEADLAVVPVENSIEGSVTMTLDALWRLDNLQIKQALVLSIEHQLISVAANLEQIQTVYSHPQALSQCQEWLGKHLPQAKQIPSNSTTEILAQLSGMSSAAGISSPRAAALYKLPILAKAIGDRSENRTRFWVLGQQSTSNSPIVSSHTSLALTLPANVPGALLSVLAKFAMANINLSRIESRPTKRSLGEYLFFMDLEADGNDPLVAKILAELTANVEQVKLFGSYNVSSIHNS